MGTPWSPTTHFSLLKPLSLSHGISGSISINGIYNHEPLIIVFSSHYHLAMASAASRSTASAGGKRNSTQLSRDISRAGSTKTQDGSAIKLFNYFITEILNMIPLDDLELPHLEEGVENILISYSLWLCAPIYRGTTRNIYQIRIWNQMVTWHTTPSKNTSAKQSH